jgi:hypothetical protein
VNALVASLNQNEWSKAMARLNLACAGCEHEVSKRTSPSFSIPAWAQADPIDKPSNPIAAVGSNNFRARMAISFPLKTQ